MISRWLWRNMEQAREDPPAGARPPRDTGVSPNGHMPPPPRPTAGGRPFSIQPVQVAVQITLHVLDEHGHCVQPLTYNSQAPIPYGDPTGLGRTPGQRLDEAIAQAQNQAQTDWKRTREPPG